MNLGVLKGAKLVGYRRLSLRRPQPKYPSFWGPAELTCLTLGTSEAGRLLAKTRGLDLTWALLTSLPSAQVSRSLLL